MGGSSLFQVAQPSSDHKLEGGYQIFRVKATPRTHPIFQPRCTLTSSRVSLMSGNHCLRQYSTTDGLYSISNSHIDIIPVVIAVVCCPDDG